MAMAASGEKNDGCEPHVMIGARGQKSQGGRGPSTAAWIPMLAKAVVCEARWRPKAPHIIFLRRVYGEHVSSREIHRQREKYAA